MVHVHSLFCSFSLYSRPFFIVIIIFFFFFFSLLSRSLSAKRIPHGSPYTALPTQLYFSKVIRRAAADLAKSHRLKESDTTGVARVDLGSEMAQSRRPTAGCATSCCRYQPRCGFCWWYRLWCWW